VSEVVKSLGVGTLVMGMWTAAGVLVGVLARSPALAVGLGLVWSLVVENLLRGAPG
jgi:ABC-2 type transport system permease protein